MSRIGPMHDTRCETRRTEAGIFAVKAYRALAIGCVGYLASVVVSSSLAYRVQDIPVVCEYPNVFPEDFT